MVDMHGSCYERPSGLYGSQKQESFCLLPPA